MLPPTHDGMHINTSLTCFLVMERQILKLENIFGPDMNKKIIISSLAVAGKKKSFSLLSFLNNDVSSVSAARNDFTVFLL